MGGQYAMPPGSGLGLLQVEVLKVRTREADNVVVPEGRDAGTTMDNSTICPVLCGSAASARNKLCWAGSSVWSPLGANTIPCGFLSSNCDRSRALTFSPL